jgi:hypothetical protein
VAGNWDTLRERRLRELIADRCSFGLIQRTLNTEFNMGISRSSVAGKAKRLGLVSECDHKKRLPQYTKVLLTEEQRRQNRTALIKRQRERRAAEVRAQKIAAEAAKLAPSPTAPLQMHKRGFVYVSGPRSVTELPDVPTDKNVGGMTLAEAQAVRGCKYATGDLPNMRFCGKPGDPWCDEHRRIVYRWAAE